MRYLFGPVRREYAEQNLFEERQAGRCLCFGDEAGLDLQIGPQERWDEIAGRLPAGWAPDLVILNCQYNILPISLVNPPVPVVALAGDWNWQIHGYRRGLLPGCDLVLTDTLGVETLQRAGIQLARIAPLFGGPRALIEADWPESERNIDLLFVGNTHPAVQRERQSYLGRLAALHGRWNVVIRAGVFGEEYRQLLGRSRIVFNRAVRGECNMRVSEAVAAGALLFQEAGNREVPAFLRDRQECVYYRDDDLEALLEHYLSNEPERRRVAEAARLRLRDLSFVRQWSQQVERIEAEWPQLCGRSTLRLKTPPARDWLGEVWQASSSSCSQDATLRPGLLAALAEKPRDAALANACGVAALLAGPRSEALIEAANAFQAAWSADSRHGVAGLNLAETLVALQQPKQGAEQAYRVLASLDDALSMPAEALDDPLFPHGFDFLRVEWERAAWQNAGNPAGEARAKRVLLRWRLQTLLGELSGNPMHLAEACLLRPDLPVTRAAHGAALARQGRHEEAVPHLEVALRGNPFDIATALVLYESLEALGLSARQFVLARVRRQLSAATGGLVRHERRFAEAAPPPDLSSPAPAPPIRVAWQGSQDAIHSLALVNRSLCAALLERGHELTLRPPSGYELHGARAVLPDALAACRGRTLSGPVEVSVTHQWPPDFTPPAEGRWVIIQPWEFGSIPSAWVAPLRERVDELWVPSQFVRKCFVKDGVPAHKVHVVPNGVADIFFQAGIAPYPLGTRKRFKFLFVGGSLERKGIDLVLKAYRQVFCDRDDVCLVIKDMGVGTFYRGRSVKDQIDELRKLPNCPEFEYSADELTDEQMAALYRACDCVVQPYRGEGFCLPVAEAMASGRPVIVTGFGPVLDYATDETAYLLPYRLAPMAEKRIDTLETVDTPYLVEPDPDVLRRYMRRVYEHPEVARARGAKAREYVRARLTWAHAAIIAERRLAALRDRSFTAPLLAPRVLGKMTTSLMMITKNEEENIAACLASVAGIFDDVVVMDTGSQDRTVEIAEALGARVFHFPWVDSFAAARNECLKHVTGEWLFWMDADDRLDDENREKLRKLVAELPDENVAFVFKVLCVPREPGGQGTVVDHVRLFRNLPGLAWEHRIHEQILPSLKRRGATPRWADVVVHHIGYQDPQLQPQKLARNLRLLHLEYQEQPHHPYTLFNMGLAYRDLGKAAEALDYFRRSLRACAVADSIVRKLYACITQCERQLGSAADALTTCREGRGHYPEDAELLQE